MKRFNPVLLALPVVAIATVGLSSPASAAKQYAHPKLHKWYADEGGKKSLSAIVKDINAISNDASGGNLTVIGNDCQNFRNDIAVAQAIDPIPSASIQRLWSKALNNYDQGAVACINGANDNSGSEITQATSDFETANALIGQLDKEL